MLTLLALLATAPGCSPGAAPAERRENGPIAAHPASGVSPSGIFETYRLAEPEDLRLSIYGVRPAAKEFPYVLLTLQNISDRELIVAYAPQSVTIHCGHYVQPGPDIYQRRRQILDPQATIVFDPPEGGWGELSPDNQPELMIPARLPPGRYTVWATFRVGGPRGGTIRSDSRVYEVR